MRCLHALRDRIGWQTNRIDELQRADVVLIEMALYNFGVASTLRAYFDHVARAKVTFRYTEHGPEGLRKGKQAYVFATVRSPRRLRPVVWREPA